MQYLKKSNDTINESTWLVNCAAHGWISIIMYLFSIAAFRYFSAYSAPIMIKRKLFADIVIMILLFSVSRQQEQTLHGLWIKLFGRFVSHLFWWHPSLVTPSYFGLFWVSRDEVHWHHTLDKTTRIANN